MLQQKHRALKARRGWKPNSFCDLAARLRIRRSRSSLRLLNRPKSAGWRAAQPQFDSILTNLAQILEYCKHQTAAKAGSFIALYGRLKPPSDTVVSGILPQAL